MKKLLPTAKITRLASIGLLSLLLVACPQQQPPPPSPNPSPDFAISLNPSSLTVEQGGMGSTTLTLTPKNGFTGQVALSLVNAPRGVSLSPTSLSVTGANPVTQALTLTVAGTVPAGTYSLKVRAASEGTTQEENLSLTVTATSQGNQIVVTARGGDPNPAYYRLGVGPWQPLVFRNGQASFYAQGEYEVVVYCEGVRIIKASASRVRRLNDVCVSLSRTGEKFVLVNLELDVPPSIGSTQLQDGDVVWVSGQRTAQAISKGKASVSLTLPPGRQPIIVAVHRLETQNPTDLRTTPIGGKVVEVDVPDTEAPVVIQVDDKGYVPFSEKQIRVLGTGVTPFLAGVDFAKGAGEGSGATYVGLGKRYGTFPNSYGGVYLGTMIALSDGGSGGSSQASWLFEDTGGSDWNAQLPDPWPSRSIRVQGASIALNHPQANVYLLNLRSLESGSYDKRVSIMIFPESQAISYTLPESLPAEFDYNRNVYSRSTVQLSAIAWVSGWDQPLAQLIKEPVLYGSSFTFNGYPLNEGELRGTRVAFVGAYATYSGGNLTLP